MCCCRSSWWLPAWSCINGRPTLPHKLPRRALSGFARACWQWRRYRRSADPPTARLGADASVASAARERLMSARAESDRRIANLLKLLDPRECEGCAVTRQSIETVRAKLASARKDVDDVVGLPKEQRRQSANIPCGQANDRCDPLVRAERRDERKRCRSRRSGRNQLPRHCAPERRVARASGPAGIRIHHSVEREQIADGVRNSLRLSVPEGVLMLCAS